MALMEVAMNRMITYSIASSVGLAIAAVLSIPTFNAIRDSKQQHQQQAPPPAATQIAPTTTTPAPPSENQTILSADLAMGQLTVTVNGAPAGSLQGTAQMDISHFCHPGANTVRLMWVGPVQGGVKATHTTAAVTRDLTEAHLVPADTQTAGIQEMALYL